MNIGVIFAGGVGRRMENDDIPKQFMKISGKPIIIRTLEVFEEASNIDKVIVSMVEEWIPYFKELLKEYDITKVDHVVPGGSTGQLSIFNGLEVAAKYYPEDSLVLIHDGVRPFIDQQLIDANIETTQIYGSAISSVPAIETFLVVDTEGLVQEIPDRNLSLVAKAPQTFFLKDIYRVHKKAQQDGIINSIDSSTLMNQYNQKLHVVATDHNNIKITTPKDIELGESIYHMIKENSDV